MSQRAESLTLPLILQGWEDSCSAYAEKKLQCRVWLPGQANETDNTELTENDDLTSRSDTASQTDIPYRCTREDSFDKQGYSECQIKLGFSECKLGIII